MTDVVAVEYKAAGSEFVKFGVDAIGNGAFAAAAKAGEPEIASYDPPWTPGPLRRNEILIRIGS